MGWLVILPSVETQERARYTTAESLDKCEQGRHLAQTPIPNAIGKFYWLFIWAAISSFLSELGVGFAGDVVLRIKCGALGYSMQF